MTTLSEIDQEKNFIKAGILEHHWWGERRLPVVCNRREVMLYIERLEAALEPFKSGEWGAWKVWLVEGAPTREEGILAAKTITKYQCRVDEVLSHHEREEAR